MSQNNHGGLSISSRVPMEERKNNILAALQRPYAYEGPLSKRVWYSLLFGVFVFLFLYIFKPFGLGTLQMNLLLLTLGYGACTSGVMLLLNVVIPPVLGNYFDDERWTVGREIGWGILNVGTIGLANVLYTWFAGIGELSFGALLWFEAYTLIIGLFPVTAVVLLRQSRQSKMYEVLSEELNEVVEHQIPPAISSAEIIITGNAGEELRLNISDLYYIRSSDNYVEVYYSQKDRLQKKLLRNTLKKLDEQFAEYPQLFRCHKGYIINLDKVKHVSGNAQGYKLHLPGTDDLVPVSRQLNDEIKERLAARTL